MAPLMALPMVLRCMVGAATVGGAAGAAWGLVRGLSYLPTLPVAIVEGAVLFGVPGAVLGLAVGCVVRVLHR